MKPTLSLLLTSILATASVTLPAFAGDNAKHEAVTESLRSLSGASFDQRFLAVMREHHEHAIEMAALASQRAQRDAVKEFAKDTAKSQQKELSDIQKLVADTRSESTTGSLHANNTASAGSTANGIGDTTGTAAVGGTDAVGHDIHASAAAKQEMTRTSDMQDDAMEKLEAAKGADFDRQFVDLMAKHHKAGQELAALAQARSTNKDVKEFAEEIQKTQAKELEKLKDLGAS